MPSCVWYGCWCCWFDVLGIFQQVADRIDPAKDLEGISETNLGRLLMGKDSIIPCTPASVMALLAASGVDLAGKEAVVIGRSEIVGKPVVMLLLSKNATVTLCHSGTSRAGRLEEHVRRAEVLVAAMGRANARTKMTVAAARMVLKTSPAP